MKPDVVRRVVALASIAGLTGCVAPSVADVEMDLTLRVECASVPEGDRVYVAGNLPLLGNWDPAAVPLERQPDGAWSRSFRVRRGTLLEFKITRGSWASEGLDEKRRIRPNIRVRAGEAPVFTVRIGGWRDLDTPASSIVGELQFHEGVGSDDIPPRTVSVWLPPGYAAESDRRYPVLYMHDGQNCFDPARSGFGMEWRMDEESTRLIGEGAVAPFIIVAIDSHHAQRGEEYDDTKLGARYRQFVVDTVKPMIDRTYRTRPDAAHTAVMGSSMGGCVSFLMAWERPDVFRQAACLSPAFFKPVLARVRKHAGPPPPIRLYIDNGGIGLEQRLQPGITMMLALLSQRGFVEGKNLQWFWDPQADHNEDAWAARVWRPLVFLFGSEKTPHGARKN